MTAGATGSLSSLLLNALAQSIQAPPNFDPCPVCLDFDVDLHPRSLALGVLIGIFLGPLIDLVYGLRILWRRSCQRWLAGLGKTSLALYRVHE